jgi:hypothetical protein
MFNDDQRDYMRSLSTMPPAAKCYCGWYPVGECPNCPPGLSVVDRTARECPECHNYPPAKYLDHPITHNIRCSKSI